MATHDPEGGGGERGQEGRGQGEMVNMLSLSLSARGTHEAGMVCLRSLGR